MHALATIMMVWLIVNAAFVAMRLYVTRERRHVTRAAQVLFIATRRRAGV